jgi:hypothetical protein
MVKLNIQWKRKKENDGLGERRNCKWWKKDGNVNMR